VVAYNFDINNVYSANGWMQAGNYQHAAGDDYNLWEGNIGPGYTSDPVHGTHHFETVFRNYLIGNNQSLCNGVACSAQTIPIDIYAGSRYFNIIGNVLGKAGYHNNYTCSAQSTATCPQGNTSIYTIGYTGNGGQQLSTITGFCSNPSCSATGSFDPQTTTYLMRWGNYDTVNNAVRWNSSEVPLAIGPYANAVPATHTLPASFYLSAKPPWWGTIPYPAIGPDVTGGPGPGGFAYNNPAASCYANVMLGPADGTGTLLSFNANTCYGSSGAAPAPPTSLSAVVH
jgi:hypothetical protein